MNHVAYLLFMRFYFGFSICFLMFFVECVILLDSWVEVCKSGKTEFLYHFIKLFTTRCELPWVRTL